MGSLLGTFYESRPILSAVFSLWLQMIKQFPHHKEKGNKLALALIYTGGEGAWAIGFQKFKPH